MAENEMGVNPEYQIPDELWERIRPLLPLPKPKKKQGRPREDDRFQQWQQADVLQALWQAGVMEYDSVKGINWECQAMDGAMTKAPLGGESTGPNPTDRGKKGTKRHGEKRRKKSDRFLDIERDVG